MPKGIGYGSDTKKKAGISPKEFFDFPKKVAERSHRRSAFSSNAMRLGSAGLKGDMMPKKKKKKITGGKQPGQKMTQL
tara:strand:- start:897 stop:1130 length:234 start_codon:yes stop_codon:yes gene_type:complete